MSWNRFRDGLEKILITTNVLSRGIDIEQVFPNCWSDNSQCIYPWLPGDHCSELWPASGCQWQSRLRDIFAQDRQDGKIWKGFCTILLQILISTSYPSYSSAWSGDKPGGRAEVNGCAEGDWEALWERHCQAWRRGRRRDWEAEPGLNVLSTTASLKLPVLYLCKMLCTMCSQEIFSYSPK